MALDDIRVIELTASAHGGIKSHYIEIVNGLYKKGIEVYAVKAFRGHDNEFISNINLYDIELSDRRLIANVMSTSKRLITIINEYKPHLIHCHGYKAGIAGRLAARKTGIKAIVTLHNTLDYILSNSLYKFTARLLEQYFKRTTIKVITVSEHIKKQVIDSGLINAAKLQVIYNGIQKQKLSNIDIKKRYGIHSHELLVGCVARLVESKGIEYLIDALPRILSKCPNVKIMIVGSGPYKNALINKVHELNVNDNVIFAGYVENIYDYYNAFDIFILPTLSEGLGISIMEAMSSGTPVIATRTGGIPEIIKHRQTGYLIAPGSSIDIALSIIYLNNNKKAREYIAYKGREYVTKKFSSHIMIDKTYSLIKDVVSS